MKKNQYSMDLYLIGLLTKGVLCLLLRGLIFEDLISEGGEGAIFSHFTFYAISSHTEHMPPYIQGSYSIPWAM